MHDLVVPLDPHGDYVRAAVRFEDQPRDAPFEVPHRLARVLVHAPFGEDVDPRVLPRGEGGGRGERVPAVGRVGVAVVRGGCEWVGDIGARRARVGRGGCFERLRRRRGSEWRMGEEADRFADGGLEGPAVRRVGVAVRGQGLSQREE